MGENNKQQATSNILVLLVTLLGGFIIANNSMAQLQGKYWYWECREYGIHSTGSTDPYNIYKIGDMEKFGSNLLWIVGATKSSSVWGIVSIFDAKKQDFLLLRRVAPISNVSRKFFFLKFIDSEVENLKGNNDYRFWTIGITDTAGNNLEQPYLMINRYNGSIFSCEGYVIPMSQTHKYFFSSISLIGRTPYVTGYRLNYDKSLSSFVGKISYFQQSNRIELRYKYLGFTNGSSGVFVKWVHIRKFSDDRLILVGNYTNNGSGGIAVLLIDTSLSIIYDASFFEVYDDTLSNIVWSWTRATEVLWDSVHQRLYIVGFASTSLLGPDVLCREDLGYESRALIMKIPICEVAILEPDWIKLIDVLKGPKYVVHAKDIVQEPGSNGNFIVGGDFVSECLLPDMSELYYKNVWFVRVASNGKINHKWIVGPRPHSASPFNRSLLEVNDYTEPFA